MEGGLEGGYEIRGERVCRMPASILEWYTGSGGEDSPNAYCRSL